LADPIGAGLMFPADPVILTQRPLHMQALLDVALEMGVTPPRADELEDIRAFAGRLMQHTVAPAEVYASALAIQPFALLVRREAGRIAGVMAQLFLRRRGVDQVMSGRFDGCGLDPSLLTHEGERPVAGYIWGVAADSKTASQAVFAASNAIRYRFFPTLTVFTRAVTPVGRHISISRYGYRPLRSANDDTLVREPIATGLEAAA
jgi:hypothetical protein